MARKSKKVLQSSLTELVKKFSQNDVIAEMEKEYQSLGGKSIPLSLIDDNSFVKKVQFSETTIARFAEGISQKALYNPLLVRPVGSHYELILGRKRYFGAKKAGLTSVPCVIKDSGDEETLLMLLADTRDQREGNVVEMALLYEALSSRFSYSQATLAKLSHQSRSQVTNIMRLLRLNDKVLSEVSLGTLSYGHARAIASLSDEEIDSIVKKIHEDNLSVRATEQLAKTYSQGLPSPYLETTDKLKKVSGASCVIEKRTSLIYEFASEEDKKAFINKEIKK